MLVPKRALAVKEAASTDETRFVLNGVYLHKNESKGEAVATDGRFLLKASWTLQDEQDYPSVPGAISPAKENDSGIIPTSAIVSAVKAMPKKNKTSLPILDNMRVKFDADTNLTQIVSTDLEKHNIQPSRIIDGTYPNYSQVIPEYKEEGDIKVKVSVEYLYKIVSALKQMEAKEVIISVKDGDRPVRLDAQSEDRILDVVGVLMPIRIR